MAFLALLDPKITINSVVMSGLAKKITLPFTAEELETTTFGNTWRTRIGGLKDASVEFDWNQDFASAQTDALLWGLYNSGAVVPVLAKATSAANSATNPEYQGNALPNDYSPFGNSVGELASVTTKWPGSGAWTRATS